MTKIQPLQKSKTWDIPLDRRRHAEEIAALLHQSRQISKNNIGAPRFHNNNNHPIGFQSIFNSAITEHAPPEINGDNSCLHLRIAAAPFCWFISSFDSDQPSFMPPSMIKQKFN